MKQGFAAALMFVVVGTVSGIAAAQPTTKVAEGVIVNSAGMTLYTFDRDTASNGKSVCNGSCIALWPALSAPDNATNSGDWTVVTRDDGKKQWAYKGKPLYTWVKDTKPGEKTGDNVNNVWHVAKP
jgi:predicted lipoprotein with Yx(FWY)xxD motif